MADPPCKQGVAAWSLAMLLGTSAVLATDVSTYHNHNAGTLSGVAVFGLLGGRYHHPSTGYTD